MKNEIDFTVQKDSIDIAITNFFSAKKVYIFNA